MKTNKTKFISFKENDCQPLELYLEQMALKGWMLNKINLKYLFKFEKCEPKNIKFCVDIFDDVFKSNPINTVNIPEYIEMCKLAGWKHIDETSKYQIFYSEDENRVPIQTDDSLKLKPVFKTTLTLSVLFLLFFANPKSIYNISNLDLSASFNDFYTFLESMMLIILPFGFSTYIFSWCIENIVWVIRAKNSLKNNREIRYPSIKSLRIRSWLKVSLFLFFLSYFLVLGAPMFSTIPYIIVLVLDLTVPIAMFLLSIILFIELIRENVVPINKINSL